MKINKKNKLKKTLLLGSLATATIAAPLAIAISCGADAADKPVNPVKQKNEFTGSFSSEAQKEKFMKITTVVKPGEFADENNLTSISLPYVTQIGDFAFDTAKLTKLSIPKATMIGDSAFSSSTLTETLSLPSVTKIGEKAFMSSSFLSVMLPKVKTIGNLAFKNSKDIKTLALDSLETIGDNVFQDSRYTIETLTVPNLKKVGYKAFGIFGKTGELPNFKLTIDWNKLVTVGGEVFAGIDNFPTGVTFNNLETVGGGAFGNYPTSMGALIIPKIKEIGGEGFGVFGGVPAGPTTITILTPEADVVFSGTSTFGYYQDAGQLTLKVPADQIVPWQEWITQNKIDHPNDSVFPMPDSDIVVVDVNA